MVERDLGGRPPHQRIRCEVARKKRELLGLSRPQLVARMKNGGKAISVKTLQQYESGRSAPDEETFCALCIALELEARDLYLPQAKAS